jgi:hypothetical protein
MTTPKKPEWFELAESDGGKPRTPVKSGARGVLLALPLMLIGAGVVVAQTADDSPAVAESVNVASAAPQLNDAPASSAIKSSSAKPIQPAIATPPTGGGDDDDDDDDDDYEDEDDEDDD